VYDEIINIYNIISPLSNSLSQYVVTNTSQGRPCPAPEQLPDLGCNVMGRQSGQAAPQIYQVDYHRIAAWQVVAHTVR